jgi:hypothetical protein
MRLLAPSDQAAPEPSRRGSGRPRWGLGASLFACVLAGPAAADPYGDPPPRREGFLIGAGLGPALFVGGAGQLADLQGVGGDLNLKIGTSAGERLLWLVELQSGGYLVEVLRETGETSAYNAMVTLTVSGHVYARDALWLRAGAGLAAIAEREGQRGPEVEGSRAAGLAALGGAGYDLFRRRTFALSVEGSLTGGVFFDRGLLLRTSVLLGITWY